MDKVERAVKPLVATLVGLCDTVAAILSHQREGQVREREPRTGGIGVAQESMPTCNSMEVGG